MMASEKRLIDANTLIAEYDRVHTGQGKKTDGRCSYYRCCGSGQM